MNELETHAFWIGVVTFGLQWAKGSRWFPFLSYAGGWINRTVAWAIGFLAGLGIEFNFNNDAHTLLITGLSVAVIWEAFKHGALEVMGQHVLYKGVVAPPLAGFQQAQIRDSVKAHQPVVPAVDPTLKDPKL